MPEPLAQFDFLYRELAKLGWSPQEVDAMEIWQTARLLGVGGGDPIIRGARLREPAQQPWSVSSTVEAERAATLEAQRAAARRVVEDQPDV